MRPDGELTAARRNVAVLARGLGLLVSGLWLFAVALLRLAWLYVRRGAGRVLPWASWVFVAVGTCNTVLAMVAALATGHDVIAELWGVAFVVEVMCLILIRPSGGFRR